MKLEEFRNQKMVEAHEARVTKMEEDIIKIRGRLTREKDILTKHEIALGRKEAKGRDSGVSQERVDKKWQKIKALEDRLEEMAIAAGILRQEMTRILEFNPIQKQLDQLPKGFRRVGEGEWSRIPNSRFKTYQDIFSRTGSRIVPAGGKRLTLAEFDKLPLQPCPVDPKLIPDWFVEEFGLGSLEGMTPFEKLERKDEVIPKVSELFEHMEPLQAYHNTTYRVQYVRNYAPEHDGKILVNAYLGQADEAEKDRKFLQVYDSAYKAERRSVETDQRYRKERSKVSDIRSRVGQINRDLRGVRRNDPAMKEIKERLEEEVKALENVRNETKIEARDILQAIKEIKDALGRHNPGAACARLLKSADFLQDRLSEIFEKDKNVTSDGHIIGGEISRSKEILDGAGRGFYSMCALLEDGHYEGDKFRQEFTRLPNPEDLRVRPFSLYAAKLCERRAAIEHGIKMWNVEVLREQVGSAYVACKVFEVQHEREQLLMDMARSPMGIPTEVLLERAVRLRDVAMSKKPFIGAEKKFEGAYADMTVKLDKIVRRLTQLSGTPFSEKQYAGLKEYLEGIDFTEILEKL